MKPRPFHRELSAWLTAHGATNVSFRHGGKHARLEFTHRGRSYSKVVPVTPSDHRAQANQLADLRRLLGPPDINATTVKQPRTLEEMTMTLNSTTPEPFNAPRILPAAKTHEPAPAPIAPTKTHIGSIAAFKGDTAKQLMFVIPNDLYFQFRALSPMQSRIKVEFLAPETWKITHSLEGRARFMKYGPTRHMAQPGSPETRAMYEHFYTTPAEFTLVDDALVAVLQEAPRLTPNRPVAAAPRTKTQAQLKTADNTTKALTTLAQTTSNPALQLAAVLEAIRSAEASTSYRLTRDKATNAWVWVHRDPVIR